ncbi:hypothetical protein CRYUN_Cryun24cG0095300 [Craigia yunnanensis]
MSCEEVLKVVFPLLDGIDLAACMLVCKQWRHIARDDYFWKCLRAKRWPSICKRPNLPTSGIKIPPAGICNMLEFHLEGPEYKMTLPVDPRFTVPWSQTLSVSVLVGRNDSNKVGCIINKSLCDYIDRTASRALAFDYLDFSPYYPFISGIWAWISLLFVEDGTDGVIDVFGIEIDFCDAASSKEEVLWLLDMIDWK